MYVNAWLIGEHAEHILNELIAPDGYPPAKVWIPLESTDDGAATGMPEFRSAYGFRDSDGDQWLDFALPPSVIHAWVGPQAMAHPKHLTHGKALRSNIESRDGVLMVKVPRYFETFGTDWTFEPVGRDPLITVDGAQTNQTTVGELDLAKSFRRYMNEPVVIIDEGGPRLFARRRESYYNVSGMTPISEVMTSISDRPSDTPVRCAWCTF